MCEDSADKEAAPEEVDMWDMVSSEPSALERSVINIMVAFENSVEKKIDSFKALGENR